MREDQSKPSPSTTSDPAAPTKEPRDATAVDAAARPAESEPPRPHGDELARQVPPAGVTPPRDADRA